MNRKYEINSIVEEVNNKLENFKTSNSSVDDFKCFSLKLSTLQLLQGETRFTLNMVLSIIAFMTSILGLFLVLYRD